IVTTSRYVVPTGRVKVPAGRLEDTLQTLEQQKAWYQSNQLALEERIKILTADLENTTNMLKYTKKLNDQVKLEKLNDQVQLEESKARSNFGLGFGETFGSDEVFDPSALSIFDTTPKDVEGKPLYDRFVKADGEGDNVGVYCLGLI
ncbi:hypothetical protein Tco_0021325, partial [Tanacetum coccineum]